jgi:hypothetical protein
MTMPSNANHDQADFFISYNNADQRWAQWIAWVLEQAGYKTINQAWDFRPGQTSSWKCSKQRRVPNGSPPFERITADDGSHGGES